ncbi:AAA family ATPase [Pectinatus haikarae]|uniref:ATP-dependent endonuclease of OLD family n=1 Tax=Pectinatus haikarae TaxID=349096 RepID=A0ABT9Y8X3_9FIRM|nr:AAA family ATPase [Pectinatus haikarae]MDQ0204292.1 putative ATP-dependent endonuclease of OLD family [Pectinatus haikarae]
MKLSRIQVNNYRQLDNANLFFQDDITILAGPNNSGKTTLISVLKGVLSDNKLKYTHNDIPVSQVTDWQKNVFRLCSQSFSSGEKAEQIIEDFISKITCEGELKPKYIINPCEIKIEVTYDPQSDDIRNFAEYIMDLDESQHSFYFIYTFIFSLSVFKKILFQYYDKINERFRSYFKKKSKQKSNIKKDLSNIIKALLIEVYSNSLVESCFFADSNYENKCKMECTDLKKLFNFKSINAARQLDDTDTDSSRTLSKSIVSLASKDKIWKESTSALPENLFSQIEDSGVKKTVREASIKTLGAALKSLAKTNGGHIGNIMLEMDVTEEDVSDLIKKITCAKYQLEGHMLNESSQGLGYSNMIYLHMQLEEFKKDINPLVVNIFFIEEPESHMHPQMQSVFIKYLLNVYKQIGLQGLVTTHSNEMVRVAGLEHLRVIRETQIFKSEIFDLSAFRKLLVTNKSEEVDEKIDSKTISILENFFDWFFEIGFSEIIFADKAVLYEGDSERLYLKKLITLPFYKKLSGQYIAFIQVGGAYAFNYKALIEFLKIKTLIITDLDYKKSALSEEEILTSKTTNSTINNFYKISKGETVSLHESIDEDEEIEDSPSIRELYEWKENEQNKLCGNLIYVVFQEKEYYARTLEEAMLSKLVAIKAFETKPRSEWKTIKSEYKLRFTLPNNRKDESDSKFSLRDILDSMSKSKTDFMYSVILNSLEEKMLPQYIMEGLLWLIQE